MKTNNLKILFIEDNPGDFRLVTDILSRIKNTYYQVYNAETVSSAEEFLQHNQVDLILLDFFLPDSKGLDSIISIIAIVPDIPIIVLTGTDDEMLVAEAVKLGAQDYLSKDKINGYLLSRAIFYAIERKKSEVSFKSIIENNLDGVLIVDKSGKIIFTNKNAGAILGKGNSELVGNYFDFPLTIQDSFSELEMDSSGRKINANVRLSEITWKNEPARLVILRDITHEKEYRLRLDHKLRLETIGLMVGKIAHDFNNLLSPIIGYSDLIESILPQESAIKKYISEINNAGKKSARLIKKLMAFSKQYNSSNNFQVIDLNHLLNNIEDLLKQTFSLKMEINPGKDPCLIKADYEQIEQVILNLVSNARDASTEGSSIIIGAENILIDEHNSLIRTENISPGNYILLTIKDSGHGMSESVIKKIFEPFYTTKDDGTGLGLPTVYSTVKGCKGFIQVESRVGEGSSFKVYFPASEDELKTREAIKTNTDLNSLRGSETILVVDDQSQVRDVAVELITPLGYNTLSAESGTEAIKVFNENKDSIAMLLTDVVMPGIDGKELADYLKELKPELKVAFMSGYMEYVTSYSDILKEYSVVIQKPFTQEEIASKIRSVFDKDSCEEIENE